MKDVFCVNRNMCNFSHEILCSYSKKVKQLEIQSKVDLIQMNIVTAIPPLNCVFLWWIVEYVNTKTCHLRNHAYFHSYR